VLVTSLLLSGCEKSPTKLEPNPARPAWSLQRTGTPCVSLWAGSPTAVFAAGLSGRIMRYDGGAWTSQISGTTVNLWGIWGNSASDVLAVGS